MKKRILCVALAIVLSIGMFVNGIAADKKSGNSGKAAPAKDTSDLDNLPLVIMDKSAGDWVVDRVAGNSMTGSVFYQGPAFEAGGIRPRKGPGECVPTPDGTVYIMCNVDGNGYTKLIEVTPDGMVNLFMGNKGLIEGPLGQCRASHPFWNPKENVLYLGGLNCIRKVVKKPDGSLWVKLVAGIPYKGYGPKEKPKDGPAKQATFQSYYRGAVCNSRGTIFWLEDRGLRRIKNGTVSSVPLKFTDGGKRFNSLHHQNLLTLGENDDTLYISDTYGRGHKRILKCDLKTGLLTRVCGLGAGPVSDKLKKRLRTRGGEVDGPALTHASSNSGIYGHYDRFYNAIWITGPDAVRLRWLKLDGDGWIRTVLNRPERGVKRTKRLSFQQVYDSVGVPGEYYLTNQGNNYIYYGGTDGKGNLYIVRAKHLNGIWRMYNKKEVKK
jgi:hypothetical protein